MDKFNLRQSIFISQAVLYGSFLLCVLIAPASLAANNGLSYFGVHPLTAIPFGAGLIISAYLIFSALGRWQANLHKPVRRALQVVALLMIGVVLTPYSISSWFDYLHTAIGTCLFVIQLIVAFWIIKKGGWHWRDVLLLAIQVAGGVIALIYLKLDQGFLLQGQVIFQLAFSGILLNNLEVLKTERPS
ncbi:MAG TPA: hypothetical protein VFP35_03105 [Candidatus Saccharimonadales bacterium]|nr:hypothetical protein [Candidatus Saccharimonadales bacterium]